MSCYGDEQRALQTAFETTDLAAAFEATIITDALDDQQAEFIASRDHFFLSSVDAGGWPTVSYKGGPVGVVRVEDERTIVFPSYDGNGMFKSLGNVLVNPHVGLLFIDFESPKRLRVNGESSVHADDVLLSEFVGAQLIVRVRAKAIFPNCPRYIHKMQMTEQSVYAPCEGRTPPVPKWKQFPEFREVLPPGDPAADAPGER